MSSKSPSKSSIRTSLVLSLGLGMVVVLIIMTFIIGQTVLKNNKSQITKSIITLTEAKGNELQSKLSESLYSAEALAGALGGTWAIPEKQRSI